MNMEDIINEQSLGSVNSCLPEHYSGKHTGSFAYITIKDRLPVILVKVVDFLCQNRHTIAQANGDLANEEVKEIIGRLSALQNEMVTNKTIKPLVCDSPDAPLWNEYLKKQEETYGFPPAWFESSWLYVECYLYRRMKQAFELSTLLKEYDPFHKQKEDSFLSTIDATAFLCTTLDQTVVELQKTNNEIELFHLFRKYLEVSLWGNKWDLSISAGKENIEQSNPLKQLEELRRNILANDTNMIWKIFLDAKKSSKEVQIDFVLDNAGFELFGDLCFLEFLHAAKLVTKVRIYVKMMPWFVSDTLEQDIHWLLESLEQSNQETLINFSKHCSKRISTGDWVIIKDKFWTLPHDYSEMQAADPTLYSSISKSDLVIFKGDLNYRKLTGDRMWEETVTFKHALGGFLPTSVVSLRTIKADVVVGLKSGTSESIDKYSQNWKLGGEFALIQCAPKVKI